MKVLLHKLNREEKEKFFHEDIQGTFLTGAFNKFRRILRITFYR